MRVLIIHNILWTHYKSVLFEEIQRQKPSEMEVMVLQIAKNELSRKNMEAPSAQYKYDYTLLFDGFIEEIPKLKKIVGVIKYIRKYKPDIVNVGGWGADIGNTMGLLYALLTFRKVVISNESTSVDHSRSFFKELFKKIVVRLSRGHIVFGKTSKDYVKKLGAKESSFLVEKGAVVDDVAIKKSFDDYLVKKETFGESKRNFLFVGRLIDVKNLPLLIKAFGILKKDEKLKDWGLIIVGNGDLEIELKVLASEFSQDITFYDSVPWNHVPQFYVQADCLVLPSFSETWGLVVNEAMICGLSVIVSDQCGCAPDLVDGNGYIFHSNDLVSLKLYLLKMTESEAELRKMQNRSIEIIKDFKVQEVAKRIIEGYKRLM